MQQRPFLSLIVPAYNEGQRIRTSLAAMSAYLGASGYPYEIIAVDDGSTDHTAAILAESGPEAIAHYTGTGGPLDPSGYAMAHGFFRALGTDQAYSALSVDCTSKFLVPELVAGVQLPFQPDIDEARLLIAIGVQMKPPFLLLLLPLLFDSALRRNWRAAVLVGSLPGVSAVGVLVLNAWMYGSPWRAPQPFVIGNPLEGAMGLLLSPHKGLFAYAPIVLLALLGAGYDHFDGRFAWVVDDALHFLVRVQQPDGQLFPEDGPPAGQVARFYSHGIATLADSDPPVIVLLSLGNLVFDQGVFETFQSMIAVVDVERGDDGEARVARASLVPFHIEGYVPKLVAGEHRDRIGRHVAHLSTYLPPAATPEGTPDGLVGLVVFPAGGRIAICTDASFSGRRIRS